MERQCNGQTPSGERSASSLIGGICSAAATRDWSRRHQRRACIRLHRQHLEFQAEPALPRTDASFPPTISRAKLAHSRLSWGERLARNARTDEGERITLTLFGIPDRLATFLGLAMA